MKTTPPTVFNTSEKNACSKIKIFIVLIYCLVITSKVILQNRSCKYVALYNYVYNIIFFVSVIFQFQFIYEH